MSPRRRGAAGIRGLGAPGTAPSKQLVQQLCSLGLAGTAVGGNPSLSPGSNSCSSSSNSSYGLGKQLVTAGEPVALFRCLLIWNTYWNHAGKVALKFKIHKKWVNTGRYTVFIIILLDIWHFFTDGRAGHIALWNRSIALEWTLILGAMVLNKKKSEERRVNWLIQILSCSLMSNIRSI